MLSVEQKPRTKKAKHMHDIYFTDVPCKCGPILFKKMVNRSTIEPYVAVISRRIRNMDKSNIAVSEKVKLEWFIPVSGTAALLIIRVELTDDCHFIQLVFVQMEWTGVRFEWQHVATFNSRKATKCFPELEAKKYYLFRVHTWVDAMQESSTLKIVMNFTWDIRPEQRRSIVGPDSYKIGTSMLSVTEVTKSMFYDGRNRPAQYEFELTEE